jgi:hypothetical protein
VLDAEHRAGAELVAWSGVHGLSTLVLDGPLRALSEEDLAVAIDRVLDGLIAGVIGHDA